MLLLNSGLLHRVGPYRLHVSLARRLASFGFLVLRFDLSGIGDSAAHKDSRSDHQRVLGDVQEAMNFMSSARGARSFVLMGLCSGAENSHRVAVADSRVCGAVFLDGYAYPTLRHILIHYGERAMTLGKWRNLLKRKLGSWFGQDDGTGEEEDPWVLPLPSRSLVEVDLMLLVERGVELLYVYTGGPAYSYLEQFTDAFRAVDFKDRLDLRFFKSADHTYTLMSDRKQLIGTICDWVHDHFG